MNRLPASMLAALAALAGLAAPPLHSLSVASIYIGVYTRGYEDAPGQAFP